MGAVFFLPPPLYFYELLFRLVVFVPRLVFILPFVPRFVLPLVFMLPVDVFELRFDIGVGVGVVLVMTAAFEFKFVFKFEFRKLPLALPVVSPQPETTNPIEQTKAVIGPESLLIVSPGLSKILTATLFNVSLRKTSKNTLRGRPCLEQQAFKSSLVRNNSV